MMPFILENRLFEFLWPRCRAFGLEFRIDVDEFATRQMMLGFPCAIFWFVAGAQAYTLSTVPWGDIYFYVFFASAFGMTIFCAFAAYGLREKKDSGTDEDEYIDEKGGSPEDGKNVGEASSEDDSARASRHTVAIRERAKRRKKRFFSKEKKN